MTVLSIPVRSTAAPPVPRMVDDVAQGTPPTLYLSTERPGAVRLGDRILFSTQDGVHGRELWITDGSAAGTRLLADICPGYCFSAPTEFVLLDGEVFFSADDGVSGRELWRTDGTTAGTRRVADLHPGPASSSPRWLTAWEGRLYFNAKRDDAEGFELFVSDGTATGTRLVADISPGPRDSWPDRLTALPTGVVFFAETEEAGREPWVSDGTDAGTRRLADVRPGPESSKAKIHRQFFPGDDHLRLNDRWLFGATESDRESYLWVTDGTPEGTQAVVASSAGDGRPGSPAWFLRVGDFAYFLSRGWPDHEIWETDGDTETRPLPLDPSIDLNLSYPVGALGGQFYFQASTAATGFGLWKTSTAGTDAELVIDLNQGPASGGGVYFPFFPAVPLGSRLIFYIDDGDTGLEPWVTDGTTEGTHLLRDIQPGEFGSNLDYSLRSNRPQLDGDLFFFAYNQSRGHQPWLTDGTSAGTRPLADFGGGGSSVLECIVGFCDDVLAQGGFRAFLSLQDAAHGLEPWVSSGTAGTTRLITDLAPGVGPSGPTWSVPTQLTPLGEGVAFVAYTGNAPLWTTDGTEAGTRNHPGIADYLTWAPEGVFLQSWASEYGYELAFLDAASHQLRVLDLLPGPTPSDAIPLAQAGSHFFFQAYNVADEQWGLYVTDPTLAGAEMIAGLDGATLRDSAVVAGDHLYYLQGGGPARTMWRSDGTAAGTGPVAEMEVFLPPRPPDRSPAWQRSLAGGDGGVFVLARDDDHGAEPWWSDGTAEGTRLLADVRPGPGSSFPGEMAVADGRLFFTADDGEHGRELWTAESGGEGAELVADLAPGAASSRPSYLTPVDGVLYFAAHRSDVGVELWRTDGRGVELVGDLAAGAAPSSPSLMTPAGRRLYFFANDGEHGFEPWSLLLPTRLPRLTMTSAGPTWPGSELDLLVVLTNPPPVPLPDGSGNEIDLRLPPGLVYLGGQATSGDLAVNGSPTGASVVAGAMDATLAETWITWNGALPAGGSVTLTLHLTIHPSLTPGTELAVDAETGLDSDGDGTTDVTLPADDPTTPGDEDPLTIEVAELPLDVPADGPGLALLALLLGALATWRLRA